MFGAEDGIRDRDVTGVQTCALPIYEVRKRPFIIAGEIIGVIGERLRRLDVKG